MVRGRLRALRRSTALLLGASGAAAALLWAISGAIVYHCMRPRRGRRMVPPGPPASERVSFLSPGDGTRIAGWYLRSAAATPSPAVVVCHGAWTGSHACAAVAASIWQSGYHVLGFDFRAHGNSGGSRITLGYRETDDVLGAVEYLLTRPEVDPARIAVVGYSMGAAAAIRAGARSSAIAAVVADSSFASFADALRYAFFRIGHLPSMPVAALTLRLAHWAARADPYGFRPIEAVGAIAPRPLLLIHGAHDRLVPVRHAYSLYDAAREPKTLWIVPGAEHASGRKRCPVEYALRLNAFLEAAFSSAAAAPPMPAEPAPVLPTTALPAPVEPALTEPLPFAMAAA